MTPFGHTWAARVQNWSRWVGLPGRCWQVSGTCWPVAVPESDLWYWSPEICHGLCPKISNLDGSTIVCVHLFLESFVGWGVDTQHKHWLNGQAFDSVIEPELWACGCWNRPVQSDLAWMTVDFTTSLLPMRCNCGFWKFESLNSLERHVKNIFVDNWQNEPHTQSQRKEVSGFNLE